MQSPLMRIFHHSSYIHFEEYEIDKALRDEIYDDSSKDDVAQSTTQTQEISSQMSTMTPKASMSKFN